MVAVSWFWYVEYRRDVPAQWPLVSTANIDAKGKGVSKLEIGDNT